MCQYKYFMVHINIYVYVYVCFFFNIYRGMYPLKFASTYAYITDQLL